MYLNTNLQYLLICLPLFFLPLSVRTQSETLSQIKSVLPSSESQLANKSQDFVAATVIDGGGKVAPFTDPPEVKLELQEEFRSNGKLQPGQKITVKWKPPFALSDVENWRTYGNNEPMRMSESWTKRMIQTPPNGTSILAFGGFEVGGAYSVHADSVYLNTNGNRLTAAEKIRAETNFANLQFILLAGTLLLPFVSVFSFNNKSKLCPAATVLAILMYFFYEKTIPAYVDIRIDLIIIFPAILFGLIASTVWLVKQK